MTNGVNKINNEGRLLFKNETKINGNQTIYSYSLTFIKSTNKSCDYIIGYFDKIFYLNLYLYRYDDEKNNITLLYTIKTDKYGFNEYGSIHTYNKIFQFYNNQKYLSCEYMYSKYYSNYMDFLVCFFNYETNVGIVTKNMNQELIYFLIKIKLLLVVQPKMKIFKFYYIIKLI